MSSSGSATQRDALEVNTGRAAPCLPGPLRSVTRCSPSYGMELAGAVLVLQTVSLQCETAARRKKRGRGRVTTSTVAVSSTVLTTLIVIQRSGAGYISLLNYSFDSLYIAQSSQYYLSTVKAHWYVNMPL